MAMKHSAGSLEQYLIPPERWDREVPGEVRVHGITDEVERYPIGYGRHPEDGWFLLGSGQGPFIIYAQWEQPAVVELDFSKPTPEPERFRQSLIDTLDRLRAVLQESP